MPPRKAKPQPERLCKLCFTGIPQNIAGHRCPHGAACRYRLREDGSVLDWKTPECTECEAASRRPRLVLSAKAHDMLG
jgi:hypothetical protein